MKRVLLAGLFVAGAFAANAQISIGVTGGINLADVSQDFADREDEIETKFRLAPRIGFVADYGISDQLSLRSGILYSSKGYAMDLDAYEDFGFGTVDGYSRFIVNYLEIPVTAVYKVSNFEITAGPYVAFGLSGKMDYDVEFTFDGDTETEAGSEKVEFTNEVDASSNDDKIHIRGLDAGLTFGLGYDLGIGTVNAFYSKGLVNLTPEEADDPEFDPADEKVTNSVLGISFTYFFGR